MSMDGAFPERKGLAVRGADPKNRKKRGFGALPVERQREIASEGGRSAHQQGKAHEWTSEEARAAGRIGGRMSRGGRGRLKVSEEETASKQVQ